VAVPADVSSVRLVGFATTDLEELSRMNPTPQMVRLIPIHIASAAKPLRSVSTVEATEHVCVSLWCAAGGRHDARLQPVEWRQV
jgi:hypothetical protein